MNKENYIIQPIRAIAIDDELSSLRALRAMVKGRDDIVIIAEISKPTQALQEIRNQKPDMLFLDIQMPTMTGFQLLEQLRPGKMPFVVFVTAYNEYAVKAFEEYALDYILKPYDHDRIEKAIARVKERLVAKEQAQHYEQIGQLIEQVQREAGIQQRFMVKIKDRIVPINPADIDWIEAAGDYVHLHVKAEVVVLHDKISTLETKLSSKNFVRVHRSTIVNVDRIKELVPLFQRDYTIVLKDGTQLKLGRTYADEFFRTLNIS